MATKSELVHLLNINDKRLSVKIEWDGSKYKKFDLITEDNFQSTGSSSSPSSSICGIQIDTKLYVVDSLGSGTGRTPEADFYAKVMKPVFEMIRLEHVYFKTTSPTSIASFSSELDCSHSYTILFLSGDTTISEFINNMPKKRPGSSNRQQILSILPLPMGTGNALASSLGYMSPVDALRQFLLYPTTAARFPIYSATFPDKTSTYFFIILSLGFHANLLHLCTNNPEYRKMGVERFQLASTRILDTYDLNLHITVKKIGVSEGDMYGDVVVEGTYAYFAVINTPNLEPKYVPSPLSSPVSKQLYLLAYSSRVDSETLVKNIMQGYKNEVGSPIGQDLEKNGIVYLPLTEDFEIELEFSGLDGQDPGYKAEVCCDGLLYNLDKFRHPVISVRFATEDQFPFQIRLLTCK